MQHEVCAEEIDAIGRWLGEVLPSADRDLDAEVV